MEWTVPSIWGGEQCWIIGAGYSISRQFGIPEAIYPGSSGTFEQYSEYLSPIHDQKVIGTNAAFLLGNWITMEIFCDSNFFRFYYRQLAEFPGLVVTDKRDLSNPPGYADKYKTLKRDMRAGLSKNPDTLCWNENTGTAAINLALLLGVKRILLLGYDMNFEINRRDYVRDRWHKAERTHLYPKPTSVKLLEKWVRKLEVVAREAEKKFPGVEIVNVNPDSGIPYWKKASLKDVL